MMEKMFSVVIYASMSVVGRGARSPSLIGCQSKHDSSFGVSHRGSVACWYSQDMGEKESDWVMRLCTDDACTYSRRLVRIFIPRVWIFGQEPKSNNLVFYKL